MKLHSRTPFLMNHYRSTTINNDDTRDPLSCTEVAVILDWELKTNFQEKTKLTTWLAITYPRFGVKCSVGLTLNFQTQFRG